MNIAVFQRKRPGRSGSAWLAAALLGVAAVLFVGLGVWQLDRAEEKRQLAASIAANADAPALELTGELSAGEAPEFRRAFVQGRFEASRSVLIGNRRFQGRPGFHVVSPLHISGSEYRVLVNRGWIAATEGRLPELPADHALQTVYGEVRYPEPPALVLADTEARAQWGRVWPYLTVEDFAAQAGYPLLPMLLLQAPEEGSSFQRDWSHKPPNPDMHTGYAIQWFAFAAIATGVAIVMLYRQGVRHD
ncbi:MAG: SURF1 family protein [Lysobacterales bacterium]